MPVGVPVRRLREVSAAIPGRRPREQSPVLELRSARSPDPSDIEESPMRLRQPALRSIRVLASVAAIVTAMSSLFILGSKSAQGADTTCSVAYQTNNWDTGFTANLTITNGGPAVSTWTATWPWGGSEQTTPGG